SSRAACAPGDRGRRGARRGERPQDPAPAGRLIRGFETSAGSLPPGARRVLVPMLRSPSARCAAWVPAPCLAYASLAFGSLRGMGPCPMPCLSPFWLLRELGGKRRARGEGAQLDRLGVEQVPAQHER